MANDHFTSRDGRAPHTMSALKWRTNAQTISRIARAAYVDGPKPTVLEGALAVAAAANGVNTGRIAAKLRRVDCPDPVGPCFLVPPTASGRRPGAKRLWYPDDRICHVKGVPSDYPAAALAAHPDLIVQDLCWLRERAQAEKYHSQ